MNRLTIRNSDGAWDVPLRNDDDGAYIPSQEIIDRLARYEDTGLEPEEMRELLHDSTGPLHKKLGEWIDAGQDGRLLVLPCRVGDTIYAPTRNFISEFRVSQFDFGGYKKPYLWVEWYLIKGIAGTFRIDGIGASEIGKTVFLSREDAEKALEGMKNDE